MASVCVLATSVQAAIVPYTEDFASDNANWANNDFSPMTFVPAGGPDGSSYASGVFDFSGATAGLDQTLLRGHDSLDSSGDAFVGNYIAEGVTTFTAKVRHTAPIPLTFFVRFAGSGNFPGAAAVNFAPVLPFTWTEIVLDLSPGSPQLVTFEGTNHTAVFSGIGNVQLGLNVPAALAGSTTPIVFDLDQPTITPEPASAGLFAAAGLALLRRRR